MPLALVGNNQGSLLREALPKQVLLLPQKGMLCVLVPTAPAHPQTLKVATSPLEMTPRVVKPWKHEECFLGGYPGRWGTAQ